MLLSIKVTPESASAAKGTNTTFAAIGTYTDGTTQDVSSVAVWSGADIVGTDVASVNAGGKVVARNIGTAWITATVGTYANSGLLSVTAAVPTALAILPPTGRVGKGGIQQYAAIATLSDGTTQDVTGSATWQTKDVSGSGVASIDKNGLATAVATGTAEIDATFHGLPATAQLSVTAFSAKPGCTADNWCWQNPLPQGDDLMSVWGSDASHIWTVGPYGTVLRWNGATWVPQPSGTTQNLRGVWGSDASHVWLVGFNGTILQWNGTSLIPQASGTTQYLRSVWGLDATHVWAVGDGGTLLHWDGTAWSAQASGTTQILRNVWGVDATHVWAVGDGGTILLWNGTTWTAQSSGVTDVLLGTWGTSATQVWTVGSSGRILLWNGTT
jgi:hypothetical protein